MAPSLLGQVRWRRAHHSSRQSAAVSRQLAAVYATPTGIERVEQLWCTPLNNHGQAVVGITM